MDDNMNLKEWEATRNLLKEFDDRIHDLRKYGFSFLTALLAAESLLIPGALSIAAGKPSIPDYTKLAVMLVTLLLIVALRMIERNYQLFIKCAAQRSRVIERSLNLELSEIICDRHRARKMAKYENYIYVSFTLGVLGLGFTILFPNYLAVGILLLFTFVAWYAIWQIKSFKIDRSPKSSHKWADWTINPLECKRGDMVRITLNNLDKDNPYPLGPGVVWEIKTQDNRLIHKEEIKEEISINSEDNYIWLWDTNKVESGIFKVYPYKWGQPLRRKIIVKERDKN